MDDFFYGKRRNIWIGETDFRTDERGTIKVYNQRIKVEYVFFTNVRGDKFQEADG